MNQLDTQPRRGFYLLPNLFTTGTIVGGFYAIVAATQGRFEAAAIAIFVAMIMDGLDGRVARMTNTQSDFGMQYDSLADLVAFGMAPALILYEWQLKGMVEWGEQWGRLGWSACLIYVVAAAWRLARFNVQTGKSDKRFFMGLPSPSAAALMVGTMWVLLDAEWNPKYLTVFALVITFAGGVLMVSNVIYYSFKDLAAIKKVPFFFMPAILMAMATIIVSPAQILYTTFLTYVLSGPIMLAYRRIRLWRRRAQRAAARAQQSDSE